MDNITTVVKILIFYEISFKKSDEVNSCQHQHLQNMEIMLMELKAPYRSNICNSWVHLDI